MTLFSLVAVFLIGGFGLFYVLSSTSQSWYITLLAALAWASLFIWMWVANRPSDER